MSTNKTQHRLKKAIAHAESLTQYLARALEKSENETAATQTAATDLAPVMARLAQDYSDARRRRDTEDRNSESYRFFDGQCVAIESMKRYLEDLQGIGRRTPEDYGVVGARAAKTPVTL